MTVKKQSVKLLYLDAQVIRNLSLEDTLTLVMHRTSSCDDQGEPRVALPQLKGNSSSGR